MSIEFRKGDLLEQDDVEFIMHQCNCFNCMNAGFAKAITRKWPEVKEADDRTKKGDINKLGTYTVAVVNEMTDDQKIIINMYSQYYYGMAHYDKGPHTDYNAIDKGLTEFIGEYDNGFVTLDHPLVVGIPMYYGSRLAGGDWKTVLDIFKKHFEHNDKFKLVICELT